MEKVQQYVQYYTLMRQDSLLSNLSWVWPRLRILHSASNALGLSFKVPASHCSEQLIPFFNFAYISPAINYETTSLT